jgi:succinyl-diaminopimelate desuccinylase
MSTRRKVRSEAVVEWLRGRAEEMAADLEELVAVATENPPGRNYRACVDVLEKQVRRAGLECERVTSGELADADGDGGGHTQGDASECLLATYGGGKRAIYFHGHYDVVPAQAAEQFRPVRKGHFIFGRGAGDMKGGIVAMLYAIRALRELGAELDGRIGLTLVPDEETGGKRGSASLAAQELLGRDGVGMLLAEPTSGVIWNANRGAISLRVRVMGKPAHVGLQHQGENAFERMHRVVEKLQGLKREVESRATTFTVGAAATAATTNSDSARATVSTRESGRNSILMLGGESGGGTNFNVVPAECWFTVDRRINPEEDLATEKARLIGVLESSRVEGIPLEWEIFQEGASACSSEEAAVGKALARSVEKVTGEAPRFEMCPGLLEIRFYAAKNIPAYAYGPGLLSVAHGPNEYVDLRKMIDTAAIYALTAMEMLGEG